MASFRRARQGTVLGLAMLLPFFAAHVEMVQAQNPNQAIAKQLLQKYAGSDDWQSLYAHPKVLPQLQKLLGPELRHLRNNLEVTGSVDVVGGDLTINGNAAHQGTEEEAVVCISTYNLEANAAIFSKRTVTIYSHASSYEYLSRCIKDWITLVNSQHRDRTIQPKNVRIVQR
jgi:hypothetical protein